MTAPHVGSKIASFLWNLGLYGFIFLDRWTFIQPYILAVRKWQLGELPMGDFSLFLIATASGVWLGASWWPFIKRWWRDQWSLFDVKQVIAPSITVDGHFRLQVKALCRARKRIADGKIILKLNLLAPHNHERTLTLPEKINCHPGEDFSVVLMNTPQEQPILARPHATLGDYKNGKDVHVAENGRYILKMVLHTEDSEQSFKVYIDCMSPGSGTCGRFSIVAENDEILKTLAN